MIYYQYFIKDNEDGGDYWEFIGLAYYSNLYINEEECRQAAQEHVDELNEEYECAGSSRFQYEIHELVVNR